MLKWALVPCSRLSSPTQHQEPSLTDVQRGVHKYLVSLCCDFAFSASSAAVVVVGYVRLSPPNAEVIASLGSLAPSVVLLESAEGAADGAVCSDLLGLQVFDCLSHRVLVLEESFRIPEPRPWDSDRMSMTATAGTAVEFCFALKYSALRCGFSPFPADL